MNQPHFCLFLQFFLNIWNDEKYKKYQQRLCVAQAGLILLIDKLPGAEQLNSAHFVATQSMKAF